MTDPTHEPCGQHTIWEPQCGTCRRLAELRAALEEAARIAEEPGPFVEDKDARSERVRKGERIRALAPDAARIAWQCSGCLWGFPDPWQKTCPACGRKGYWSGSVHPSAKLWRAPPSVHPASERPSAPVPPGAEALAKSDVAALSGAAKAEGRET